MARNFLATFFATTLAVIVVSNAAQIFYSGTTTDDENSEKYGLRLFFPQGFERIPGQALLPAESQSIRHHILLGNYVVKLPPSQVSEILSRHKLMHTVQLNKPTKEEDIPSPKPLITPNDEIKQETDVKEKIPSPIPIEKPQKLNDQPSNMTQVFNDKPYKSSPMIEPPITKPPVEKLILKPPINETTYDLLLEKPTTEAPKKETPKKEKPKKEKLKKEQSKKEKPAEKLTKVPKVEKSTKEEPVEQPIKKPPIEKGKTTKPANDTDVEETDPGLELARVIMSMKMMSDIKNVLDSQRKFNMERFKRIALYNPTTKLSLRNFRVMRSIFED